MASRRNQTLESEHGGETERRPHQPSIFLVAPCGYGQKWVSCPVCEAEPDGWDDNGAPRYKGGVVEILVHRPSGGQNGAVAACRCEAGKVYSERAGKGEMARFDRLPPNTEFVTRPTPILWIKGKSKGNPPPEVPIPNEAEYVSAHGDQVKRFMANEITREQWRENCEALDAKYLPPKIIGPTIGQLLDPAAGGIRDLYFAAFSEMVEWSGPEQLPAADFNERGER